ncbi:hypothetical protein CL619_01315 [archaeon]|nr:hypothetical protein [archaeon]|tara:strand:+ start:110 stop:427 length:318 start_codon:yes stop_codon:yes gene_type:complete
MEKAKTQSFTVAIKSSPNGTVLVITDTELIGQKFENERLQLDLSKKFYEGELMSSEELSTKLDGAYVLHVTGKKAVEFVSELGLIDSKKVLEIAGVPHAEVYLGM